MTVQSRWFLCGVLILWMLAGCKDAKKEAYELASCPKRGSCTKPNRCLRSKEGRICVQPCAKDQDCPESMRCSGRHGGRFGISVQGSFCRRALVDVGGSCVALKDGCRKGLMCFDSHCARRCKTDQQCADHERCIPFTRKNFTYAVAFRVCLRSDQKEDAPCGGDKLRCTRGLVCIDKRCTRPCKRDRDCGSKKRCEGAVYPQSYLVGIGNPSYYYCMDASLSEGASCKKGPSTCQYGLQCISGICRKLCKTDEDCQGETTCRGKAWKNKYVAGIGRPDYLFCK